MARRRNETLDLPPSPRFNGGSSRTCAAVGCTNPGVHRAPISRDRLEEYYWFCLDHVREYNQAWDFFAGMDEGQIEAQRRFDTVWQRPSWPFSGQKDDWREGRQPRSDYRVRDDFGFFRESAAGEAGRRSEQRRLSAEVQQALAMLGLDEDVSWDEVKSRYKSLAKKLHPDANGGNCAAEERLKLVNQAYTTLKIDFAETLRNASP